MAGLRRGGKEVVEENVDLPEGLGEQRCFGLCGAVVVHRQMDWWGRIRTATSASAR